MRMRYTFEIVAVALLMATGSLLSPMPQSGCGPRSAILVSAARAAKVSHLAGGQG